MVEQGLLEEVRSLLGRGTGRETPAMRGLGYRHMVQFLQGTIPLEDAVETLKRDTRHYAKRQITWFCNQEKVTWFQPAQVLGISDRIQEFFSAV
jgi:tRNA dimethylallyltransferase